MTDRTDFRDFTRLLYETISAPSGERDWPSVRELYHADARMVRTGIGDDGKPFARVMSLDDYIENVEELLHEVKFSEIEISHDVTVFGNVAQLASVYEYQLESAAATRSGRGVNFFTLIQHDGHWQIMSIVWDNERDTLHLPQRLFS